MLKYMSIRIRLSSSVTVSFHTGFKRWYMTDDAGLSWIGLSKSIRNAQTAIDCACRYYMGSKADNA